MPAETARPSRPFLRILLYALLLRLAIAAVPWGHAFDQSCFKEWGIGMVKHGPALFYPASHAFTACDYPPLYLYWLWGWSWLYTLVDPTPLAWTEGIQFYARGLLNSWLKLPLGVFDLVNAWLIWRLLSPRLGARLAQGAVVLYLFNPVFLYDSVYWGQLDTLSLAFMLAILAACLDGSLLSVGALAALSLLFKPQGIFLAPVVLASQWFRRPPAAWLGAAVAGVGVTLAVIWPFWPDGGVVGAFQSLFSLMASTAGGYPFGSVNAFNFHGLWGLNAPDSATWLGVTQGTWGLALLGAVQLLVAIVLYRRRDPGTLFLGAAIGVMAFFMFAPRMHERYGVVAIGLLTVACAFNPRLKKAYWILSAVALLNLHFVLNTRFGALLQFMDLYKVLCAVNLLAFGGMVLELVRLAREGAAPEARDRGVAPVVGQPNLALGAD